MSGKAGRRGSRPAGPARGGHESGRRQGARASPPTGAPAPPLTRDAWALAPIAAALLLALHAWFPFIGEPVADDFDFLHHAFFAGPGAWFDGGGSRFYWRPLARQLPYRLLGGTMLAHAAWVSVLETALVALAGLMLYRALRRHWPAAWAAAAACFPLLIEAGRTLVSTPTSFQDVGAILFSALALQQAAGRRLAGALAALVAALLCKEMAVVTAAALPLMMPPAAATGRTRLRWAAAAGALVGAWAIVYRMVLAHAGLLLARQAGQDPQVLGAPWTLRLAWACGESLRDALSLPALAPAPRTGAIIALGGIGAAALVTLVRDRSARARVRRRAAWIMGGLAWFMLASATLADVYPDWRPYRSPFGALGLGVACTAFFGAVRPALLAALMIVHVASFALGPRPPQAIAPDLAAGYSLDFAKLVQFQRLVGETRRALGAALPRPARGALVAAHFYPRGALHAFAGDRSLHTWYRDTTLHWAVVEEAVGGERRASTTVLQFQPTPPRQVVPVSAQALWHVEAARRLIDGQRWGEALRELAVAESLEHDPVARLFASMVAGKRALALVGVGRVEEADREALRSRELWAGNDDASYALVGGALRRGRLREAAAVLDTLVRRHPEDAALRKLLADTRRALAGRSP